MRLAEGRLEGQLVVRDRVSFGEHLGVRRLEPDVVVASGGLPAAQLLHPHLQDPPGVPALKARDLLVVDVHRVSQ